MIVKVGWIFIENNGVLMMSGNYKKSLMNIILSPSNDTLTQKGKIKYLQVFFTLKMWIVTI